MNPKQMLPAPVDEPLAWPLSPAWAAYFQGVFSASRMTGGTTAQRPTEPILYQPFFDTTLGYPVWCKTVTPSVVWVNGAGTTV